MTRKWLISQYMRVHRENLRMKMKIANPGVGASIKG
jgi:hypothetical protein